jgi:nitrite reductase (NO-forming)
MPGQETVVTFKALNPGLYVYHCATAPIPAHIANGMYGLILVEPEGGLPPVDREFYVVQGELYTSGRLGLAGHHDFDGIKMDAEEPDYVVFNGKVGSLTGDGAMTAKVGERVRIYFGVGGFLPSSLHLIGEIFDRVYPEGAMGSAPNTNVQTTLVPAGGSTIVEFTLQVPGNYTLVDHALARALDKGAAGLLTVTGDQDKSIYSGPISGSGH